MARENDSLMTNKGSSLRVHWLQHIEHETLGSIEPWLRARGHRVACTRLFAGEVLPAVASIDWLIVMGGPMNIDQHRRYPWLAAEKNFIDQAIVRNVRALGICLGAQLIASVLGARVHRGRYPEIGFFDVYKTDDNDICRHFDGVPRSFKPLHWHGDTYSLPAGAVGHHKSDVCVNQSFSWGPRVLAMQYHLEVTRRDARRWLERDPPRPGRFVQSGSAIQAQGANFASSRRHLHRILENFADA